jgi:hypothetical protein
MRVENEIYMQRQRIAPTNFNSRQQRENDAKSSSAPRKSLQCGVAGAGLHLVLRGICIKMQSRRESSYALAVKVRIQFKRLGPLTQIDKLAKPRSHVAAGEHNFAIYPSNRARTAAEFKG